MRIYNSLSRKVEEFVPIEAAGGLPAGRQVGMYSCGPTVYDYSHIGHGRKYVGDDILKRVLTYLGYQVKQVMNVTDVGHLTSDADEGEDKLEKGAAKTGKTVWEVAQFYTDYFEEAMGRLNVLPPDVFCKATEHIPEQIELIKKLVEKGLAYDTPEAVYYDVTKFAEYDRLFGQELAEKQVAVREEVKAGEYKKHPADFALWFKRVGRFANHTMHWDSPWGDGFPGWHLECSAMSMKYLGEQFDLHTGGEDHQAVHHPNEIAQSEGATGKRPFVKYWVHHGFLKIEGQKMSKSLGNFLRLEEVEAKGFDPLSLRYLYLTTHYRKVLNFTWEGLTAAQTAFFKLREQVLSFKEEAKIGCAEYEAKFKAAIEDDLNMPEALAVVWGLLKSDYPDGAKKASLLRFDEVLGLRLAEIKREEPEVSEEIKEMLELRERLRSEGRWDEADLIRDKIKERGYLVEDTSVGAVVRRLN